MINFSVKAKTSVPRIHADERGFLSTLISNRLDPEEICALASSLWLFFGCFRRLASSYFRYLRTASAAT